MDKQVFVVDFSFYHFELANVFLYRFFYESYLTPGCSYCGDVNKMEKCWIAIVSRDIHS